MYKNYVKNIVYRKNKQLFNIIFFSFKKTPMVSCEQSEWYAVLARKRHVTNSVKKNFHLVRSFSTPSSIEIVPRHTIPYLTITTMTWRDLYGQRLTGEASPRFLLSGFALFLDPIFLHHTHTRHHLFLQISNGCVMCVCTLFFLFYLCLLTLFSRFYLHFSTIIHDSLLPTLDFSPPLSWSLSQ